MLAQFCAGFWLYCNVRALHENFGFSPMAFASSLGFTALLSLVPIYVMYVLPVAIWRWLRRSVVDGSWFVLLLLIFVCLLAGVCAEVWMLLDEMQFTNEVTNPANPMWRARAWPNETSSLLYSPTRGFWAGT